MLSVNTVTCREVIMAKRIYVADDELHIRTLIQTFLVNEGYEVETFEDGNSLFDAFHASCPDLIILDVMMPGMGTGRDHKRCTGCR